jgi:putative FmdB family regulatory protein
MPLYEYECDACKGRFEVIQKFSDAPAETCRACGKGPVRRLMSSPAIQFKGSGWYITDYSQKGKPPASDSGSGSSAGADKSGNKDTSSSSSSSDGSSSDTGKSTPAATPATPAPAKSD